jgi:hypothetical protein
MTDAHKEVQAAVNYLLQIANKHKIAAVGFCFAAEPEPLLINFGNTTDCHEGRLYQTLVDLCETQRAAGKVITQRVDEIQ